MKQTGMTITYVEVEDGTHGSVVAPSFPAIFDFFDADASRAHSQE